MTAGTGPSCRPKQMSSATAATAHAARPAERRRRLRLAPFGCAGASPSAVAAPNVTAPRVSLSMRNAFGRMFLKMTPKPAPIMTPMPRLDTIP